MPSVLRNQSCTHEAVPSREREMRAVISCVKERRARVDAEEDEDGSEERRVGDWETFAMGMMASAVLVFLVAYL